MQKAEGSKGQERDTKKAQDVFSSLTIKRGRQKGRVKKKKQQKKKTNKKGRRPRGKHKHIACPNWSSCQNELNKNI